MKDAEIPAKSERQKWPDASTIHHHSPSLPGVEGAPATAREASRPTRGTPEESAKDNIDLLFNAFTRWGDGVHSRPWRPP